MERIRQNKVKHELIGFLVISIVLFLAVYVGIRLIDHIRPDPYLVALETQDPKAGLSAVTRLKCQESLADVALEARLLDVRLAAATKLINEDLLTQLIEQTKDKPLKASFKLSIALANAPKEHRERLREKLMPSIRVLTDPEVVDEVGEITSIWTDWSGRTAQYRYRRSGSAPPVRGEWFKCSIRLTNLSQPLSGFWKSTFPAELSAGVYMITAPINSGDLLNPVFKRLPQSLLARIAENDEDVDVRMTAVGELSEQDALATIAMKKDENWSIRHAAFQKITDQEVLTKMAVKADDYRVRRVALDAIEKLINQELLARIAEEAKDREVRRAAIEKLKDQKMLARIAQEDNRRSIRRAAQKRLDALSSKE